MTERLRVLRIVEDMFVPRPAQEAALELVTSRSWDRHLRSLSEALAERCEATVSGVRRHLPGVGPVTRPRGGMHLWVPLGDGVDDVEAAARARAAGVIVMPGRPFFPAEPAGPHLRLTFAAAADVAEIEEGLRRLGGALPSLGSGGT